MHRKAQDGSWVECTTEISIQRDGGALGANGQQQLYIPGSLYTDALKCTTSDGKTLISRPIGLALFDGERSALIGELRDGPVGQLLPSGDKVIFTNICTDVQCDLLVEYKKAGYESSLVLREAIDPTEWGFSDGSNVRLQWLTEFFSPPPPRLAASESRQNMTDTMIDFGAVQMLRGKGFLLEDSQERGVRVLKQWLVTPDTGRTVLVEEVPWQSISEQIKKLPLRTAAVPKRLRSQKSEFAGLPKLPLRRPVSHASKPIELAVSYQEKPGFLVDYDLSGSVTNFVFAGDTTYYVAGTVNLSSTTNSSTVFEGNCVIKFTNTSSAKLSIAGPITFKTAPYRMALLTSKDDNSCGTSVSGSTGSPTNTGATFLDGPDAYTTYQYLRYSYAGTAISAYSPQEVKHSQFFNCSTAISGVDDTDLKLRNVLFTRCGNGVHIDSFGSVAGEHVTADQLNKFLDATPSSTGCKLTNCIITSLTNAFGTNVSLYFCTTNSSSAGMFQSVGAGNYYLIDGSTNRGSGTTNINQTLASDLRHKTTYPPIIYSNITFTTDTTLSPQAQRDTGLPDRGFLYDPIDYIAYAMAFTNCSLTVNAGTAIASCNGTAVRLAEGGSIHSVGTPLAPNWFIRYQTVQEQPLSLGLSTPDNGIDITTLHTGSPAPNGTFRFSRFSCPAGGGYHIYHDTGWNYGNLLLQDSEIWGGANKFAGVADSIASLQNNLFNRTTFPASIFSTNTLSISNNLFWGVTGLSVKPSASSPWAIFNNVFDSCSFSFLQGSVTNSGNNAYYNCNRQLTPTNASDISLTNALPYKSGPLGDFYQATNSPLINLGSCTANVNGLYHYTVTTNLVSGLQIKETNSVTDIGLHYLATDSNGQPIDTDGDGSPDYFEDANGNGSVDAGETGWNSYNSPTGLSAGSGLQVFTPLKP